MALAIATSAPEIDPLTAIEQVIEVPTPPTWEEIVEPRIKKAQAQRLKARKKACKARGGTLEASGCVIPVYTPPTPVIAPEPVTTPVGELTGSLGYSLPWGNCVNQVPISIRPNGSPYQWLATTQTPYIGAVALFTWNHTGIVTGIWSNGDLEIRHENAGGMGHRVPRSMLRGFR